MTKNIHDSIYKTYDGTWTVDIQVRKRGELISLDKSVHATGLEALTYAINFCSVNSIEVAPFDWNAWTRYYNDCDSHLQSMMAKKGTMSESQWQMAFSCDAPNKPGYFRANND